MIKATVRHRNDYRSWPHGCWPNDDQLLLLRACLLKDKTEAQDSFREWERRVPFFCIDSGSQMLLLLLYHRLKRWKLEYKESGRLVGAVRHHWMRRQCVERELASVLKTLRQNNIKTLLLKGAALNGTAYPEGTRLMSDLDIVVPRAKAHQAMRALQADGWIAEFRDPERLPAITHGCHFRRGDLGQVDLHWDFFHGRHLTDAEQDELWSKAFKVERRGESTSILCPEDQLLHTCEHGLRYNRVPPFRWLADAFQIADRSMEDFDWDRLARMAERHDVVLPVGQTLAYLHHELGLKLPKAAENFTTLPVNRWQRLAFTVTTRRSPGAHPFWKSLPSALIDYRRLRRANPQLPLLEYLARVNNIEPPLSTHLPQLLKVQLCSALHTAFEWGWQFPSKLNPGRKSSARFGLTHVPDELLEGFYGPEFGVYGTFRWAQPVAAVQLPIPPKPVRIEFRLLPFRPLVSDLARQISVRVNRHIVPTESICVDKRSISFTAPKNTLNEFHPQRLELRCPLWDHQSADPRKLGLPLSRVAWSVESSN